MVSFQDLDTKDFQRYGSQNTYFNQNIRKDYQNYDIDSELIFADILNDFLSGTSISARRVSEKKSHHDIEVVSKNKITKIDIEAPHYHDKVFSNYPQYSGYWKFHRYLARKVDAIQPNQSKWFDDCDVYIQYNKSNFTQLWWTTFGIIRTKCSLNRLIPENFDPRMREVYYQSPKETHGIVQYDIDTLINYLLKEHTDILPVW